MIDGPSPSPAPPRNSLISALNPLNMLRRRRRRHSHGQRAIGDDQHDYEYYPDQQHSHRQKRHAIRFNRNSDGYDGNGRYYIHDDEDMNRESDDEEEEEVDGSNNVLSSNRNGAATTNNGTYAYDTDVMAVIQYNSDPSVRKGLEERERQQRMRSRSSDAGDGTLLPMTSNLMLTLGSGLMGWNTQQLVGTVINTVANAAVAIDRLKRFVTADDIYSSMHKDNQQQQQYDTPRQFQGVDLLLHDNDNAHSYGDVAGRGGDDATSMPRSTYHTPRTKSSTHHQPPPPPPPPSDEFVRIQLQ